MVVPPKGRKFEVGVHGFKGGITRTMVAIVKGDNVFTISARGTTGVVFYRAEPYVPTVRLISVMPNENIIDGKYLYCVLLNTGIKGIGSVQSQLTIPDVEMKDFLF